jgi:hypothetical protein
MIATSREEARCGNEDQRVQGRGAGLRLVGWPTAAGGTLPVLAGGHPDEDAHDEPWTTRR